MTEDRKLDPRDPELWMPLLDMVQDLLLTYEFHMNETLDSERRVIPVKNAHQLERINKHMMRIE